MIRLFLVRHGENPANLTKEFSYRKVDYPLTKKGQLQARQTGLSSVLKGREDQNIIIVGHGALFTLTLKDICPDVDTTFLLSAENHNCSISEVHIKKFDGHWQGKLIQWAFTDHLNGDAAKLVSGVPNLKRFQSSNQPK